MKTGVVFENVKYYVNKEKKVVVCTASCHLSSDDYDLFSYDMRKRAENKFGVDICMSRFEVKGIAKCSSDDVFNEELGKKIAESKAKRLAFKYVYQFRVYCLKLVYKELKEKEKLANNCSLAAEHEDEHINYLLENQ